jgi:hypothetical protein
VAFPFIIVKHKDYKGAQRREFTDISKQLNGMKLLPRLVIVLVVCLTAIALPAVPAQAYVCFQPVIVLSPNSGVPGTEVAVDGRYFDAAPHVNIYYDGTKVATGNTDDEGDFTVIFTVPESYTGTHEVHAEALDDMADALFTVEPGLTVSPEKGPAGTTVTVNGQGFAEDEEGIELRYYLNGGYDVIADDIPADEDGSWGMSFQIPHSTRGEHKIDAGGDESKFYDVEDVTFNVTAGISIDESSGIVGESITMTGIKFAANERYIKILFDGEAVVTDIKANAEGYWEESFTVPEMPTGEYSITAEGEQTPKEDLIQLSFEIEPGIVLSPEEGHVGMDLTATGHGFAANEDVNIMYDNSQVATAKTNDKGSFFDVSFSVPESQHGERQVTAEDAEGNKTEQPAIFTMESDPPDIPKLISPSNESRVGLIGRVKPTFEWSEVSDESGVYYRLKIATSANVTTSAGIVLVTDLTETSYTLDRTLNYGTYYWIVQAVDGAENESGWTAARSFRAGLLPLGGFIAIITAAVAGIIVLVRFLLRKRGIYYL